MDYKKYFNIKYLVLSLVCLSLNPVNAKEVSNNNTLKEVKNNVVKRDIAFVDFGSLMSLDPQRSSLAVDKWRDGLEVIKRELDPTDKKLGELDKQYADGIAELKSMQKSELTSKSALQRKFEEIAKLEQELKIRLQEREALVNQKLTELRDQVKPNLDNIVEGLRKDEDLTMIFKIQKDAVCAPEEADLTEKVFKRANNIYAEELKLAKAEKSKADQSASELQA